MDRNVSHHQSSFSGPRNRPQRRVSVSTLSEGKSKTDSFWGVSGQCKLQFEKRADSCKLPSVAAPRQGIVALPLNHASDETTRNCEDTKHPMLDVTDPPKLLRRQESLLNANPGHEAKLPLNSDPFAWNVMGQEISRNCANNKHLNLDNTGPTEVLRTRHSLPNIPRLNAKIFGRFENHQHQEYGEHASIAKWRTNSKSLQKFVENAERSYDRNKEKAILLHNWMLQQGSSKE